MAEDGPRFGGLSSGLAVILNVEDGKENLSRSRFISCCDDLGCQSVERTLEYLFALPNNSLGRLNCSVDKNLVRSILKNEFLKYQVNSEAFVDNRDGIAADNGGVPQIVGLEEVSMCGDIRIVKSPLLLESLAMFSSARANVRVWKGKWMYEVTLETSGIQQLGWATVSCPFTDHKGVGDVDDSYAFDGRRVKKWNKEAETYGQPWVASDIIGCCIDLDCNEISFYRNGTSLGVAFSSIRKLGPAFGYYPAISLSQGERCELNFGAHPFRHLINGYLPLQEPPSVNACAVQLLRCLSRLLGMEWVEHSLVEKSTSLKRFVTVEELFYPVSHGICEEFFSVLEADTRSIEYVSWGILVSFMMEVFGVQVPHDYSNLDRVVDIFLQ